LASRTRETAVMSVPNGVASVVRTESDPMLWADCGATVRDPRMRKAAVLAYGFVEITGHLLCCRIHACARMIGSCLQANEA
jgi:hypothetical protein